MWIYTSTEAACCAVKFQDCPDNCEMLMALSFHSFLFCFNWSLFPLIMSIIKHQKLIPSPYHLPGQPGFQKGIWRLRYWAWTIIISITCFPKHSLDMHFIHKVIFRKLLNSGKYTAKIHYSKSNYQYSLHLKIIHEDALNRHQTSPR